MITFIEGGMTIPMDRVTRDYLLNHRLTPHQCAPNLFRVLGNIDALNKQMGLRLMQHDVVHMQECHKLKGVGYYLKSRSDIIRLISCLPKSNNVVHIYECHKLKGTGYYLKSRFDIIRLVSCLPKSNKGMKDNYLIASKKWHDGLHCPTREGDPGGVP